MEYQLIRDHKINYIIFWSLLIIYIIGIYLSFKFLGIIGLALTVGFLSCLLIAPLLIDKTKQMLFIWLLIVPIFDISRFFLIGGVNPLTYFITGLSLPLGMILLYKHGNKLFKDLPFLWLIIVILMLVLLDLLRGNIYFLGLLNEIKSRFVEIFIITITYLFLKKYEHSMIFKWLSVYSVINFFVAIFQRFTGIGLVAVDGVLRVTGLTGNANTCAFLVNTLICLGMYKLMTAKNTKEKLWWGLNVLINIFVLVLTLSKTAFLIFFIILFAYFLFMPSKLKIRMVSIGFFALIFFIIVNYAFNLEIIESVARRFTEHGSLLYRFKLWGYIISDMDLLTFFIGKGTGAINRILLQYNHSDGILSSHNIYLKYIYEFGIFGLSYLLIFAYVALKFLKEVINKANTERLSYLVPLLICTSILLTAFVDNAVAIRSPMNVAWVIIIIYYLKLDNKLIHFEEN